MGYGLLTWDRHKTFKDEGIDLHVFVDGVDVTSRCHVADDTPGHAYAVLYKRDASGYSYVDVNGELAQEIVTGEVVIRTVGS